VSGSREEVLVGLTQEVENLKRLYERSAVVEYPVTGAVSGSGAATRVTYWSAANVLTGSANFTFDGSQVALAVQGSSGGVLVGGDVQWYRNAANVWRTPDSVMVDSRIGIGVTSASVALHIFDSAVNEKIRLDTSDSNGFASQVGFFFGGALKFTLGAVRTAGVYILQVDDVGGAVPWKMIPATGQMGVVQTALTGQFHVMTGSASRVVSVFEAAAAQTADLSNWLNASAAIAVRIGATGGMVVNEAAAVDAFFRVEGGSMSHMIYTDAAVATENIALLTTAAPNWQTMDRGLFIGDRTTAPTGNPTSGGFLSVNAGAGVWRGSGGTITTFGPAGPHCGNCGYDAWTVAVLNHAWQAYCYICGMCGAEYRAGPQDVFDLLQPEQHRDIIRVGMSFGQVSSIVEGPAWGTAGE
jgi:hypothetical protein